MSAHFPNSESAIRNGAKSRQINARVGNNILDSVRPPWEAATLGVVSLMTMLEFAARRYVELSHQLGLLLGTHCKRTPGKDFADSVGYLLSETKRLGLRTTQEHIYDWIRELMKENPGRVKLQSDGLVTIHDIELNSDRTCHHIETIYSAMRAELSVILFRAIPKEKNGFCDSEWLRNTVINKFPETVDEFQKAGRCFAYGENTACVFHLMRVADFYFRKVAESLPDFSYDGRNWHGIGQKITNEMEKKYNTKTREWKDNETFYAEVLTDIQAISRGHRNPVLHEIEKKYDERETLYMLTVIEAFSTRVAGKL
jgi:hypothetical protein